MLIAGWSSRVERLRCYWPALHSVDILGRLMFPYKPNAVDSVTAVNR